MSLQPRQDDEQLKTPVIQPLVTDSLDALYIYDDSPWEEVRRPARPGSMDVRAPKPPPAEGK